jgi:hypothetical protein
MYRVTSTAFNSYQAKPHKNLQGLYVEKGRTLFTRPQAKAIKTTQKLVIPEVVLGFDYQVITASELVVTKSIYGVVSLRPALRNYYPGFILYPYKFLKTISHRYGVQGQLVPL